MTGCNAWWSVLTDVWYSFCALHFGVPHDDFVVHYIVNEICSWEFEQHYKMADSLQVGVWMFQTQLLILPVSDHVGRASHAHKKKQNPVIVSVSGALSDGSVAYIKHTFPRHEILSAEVRSNPARNLICITEMEMLSVKWEKLYRLKNPKQNSNPDVSSPPPFYYRQASTDPISSWRVMTCDVSVREMIVWYKIMWNNQACHALFF